MGDHLEEVKFLRIVLDGEFRIKILGQLKYFLRMEIACTHERISISIEIYPQSSKGYTTLTSMEFTAKNLMEEEASQTDKGRYQRIVGILIYRSYT